MTTRAFCEMEPLKPTLPAADKKNKMTVCAYQVLLGHWQSQDTIEKLADITQEFLVHTSVAPERVFLHQPHLHQAFLQGIPSVLVRRCFMTLPQIPAWDFVCLQETPFKTLYWALLQEILSVLGKHCLKHY